MWGRTADQGRSKADLFQENGLRLTKSSNDREAGWLAIHELLRHDEQHPPRLRIFKNCRELIKYLPMLQYDERKPTDTATEPHEITHACLTGDTVVDGVGRIEDLVGTVGMVTTIFNGDAQKCPYQMCVYMGEKDTILLTFDNGKTLQCTPDHLILTNNRGWVQAGDLTEEDDICELEDAKAPTQRQ